MSRSKSAKELHIKRKHNNKTIHYISSPTNVKICYTRFVCNSFKVKKCAEKNKIKVYTQTVRKRTPKETNKSPVQCYICTECNLTFDTKVKKHNVEQHKGKLVKSSERKSPKLNQNKKKIISSNKEEFREHVTAEWEEIYVKIVKMDVKKYENLMDLLSQTGQENKHLKSDIRNELNSKKI